MENAQNIIIDNSFIILSVMLASGIFMGAMSEKLKVPDVVLYLLTGIILGPTCLNIVSIADSSFLNQIILVFGAAFLLYVGGTEINISILNKVKYSVLSLATLGVLISTFTVGLITHFIFSVDLLTSLLIGATVASTDPASLIPVFQKVTIKDKVKQTIISESAFNDAMGTVVVITLITIIQSGEFVWQSSLLQLVKMMVVGCLIGVIVGYILNYIFSEGRINIYQFYFPIISIIAIVITYTVADMLGGSGYMATFILGIICGNKLKFGFLIPEDSYITDKYFRHTMSTVIIMTIFILLGTHFDFIALALNWPIAVVVTLILMFIARPLTVFICTALDPFSKWSLKEKLFLSWVRETGVIPAAMSSIIVAMRLPNYELISAIVFTVILSTLLVQGSTTEKVAKKLSLLVNK